MPSGVYLRTKKRKWTAESKKRRSDWAKTRTGEKNSFFGKKHTEDSKHKNRLKHIGKKTYERTLDIRKKMSESRKGDGTWNWKGGVESKNKRIRKSVDFKIWREKVFKRDNYTCQKTKIKGGELHPHHIRNFAEYPELRFAIDNGITLSEKSHNEFHEIYGRINNTKEQLIEFLKN